MKPHNLGDSGRGGGSATHLSQLLMCSFSDFHSFFPGGITAGASWLGTTTGFLPTLGNPGKAGQSKFSNCVLFFLKKKKERKEITGTPAKQPRTSESKETGRAFSPPNYPPDYPQGRAQDARKGLWQGFACLPVCLLFFSCLLSTGKKEIVLNGFEMLKNNWANFSHLLSSRAKLKRWEYRITSPAS